jgi:futalosine hydrolase
MPLALVTATAAEMRSALAGLAVDASIPGRGASPARICGRDMLLVVTGVGPVNAALETGACLDRYGIAGVLNAGVAGSFDLKRAPLRSVAVATAEVYAEYGVVDDGGLASTARFAFPQWEKGALRVAQRLELSPEDAAKDMTLCLPQGAVFGTGLTVAGVTGTPMRAQALSALHGALTESMEGFALALACVTRGLPFLEVRTISNGVGEADRTNWKLNEAMTGLGTVLAGMLSGGPA